MAVRSSALRILIIPGLCFALLANEFMTAQGSPLKQIERISVNRTLSRFVAPLSQDTIAHLADMNRFATLLTPAPKLSKDNWLVDDSSPPKLSVQHSNPAIGQLAVAEGDNFTAWIAGLAVTAFVVAATAAVTLAVAGNTPTARITIQVAKETAKISAATLGAYAAERALETTVIRPHAGRAAAEATAAADNTRAASAGGGYIPSKLQDQLVQLKRVMMLRMELDGQVLAAM